MPALHQGQQLLVLAGTELPFAEIAGRTGHAKVLDLVLAAPADRHHVVEADIIGSQAALTVVAAGWSVPTRQVFEVVHVVAERNAILLGSPLLVGKGATAALAKDLWRSE